MKTKIAILCFIFAALSLAVASKSSDKSPKTTAKKSTSAETRVGRGLAMEDKNQFN
jgi:hypothetical protein